MPLSPYRVRIRWPVDCLTRAVRPVYVQAAPTIPPAPDRSQEVAARWHHLKHDARLLRAIGPTSATSGRKQKGGALLPPHGSTPGDFCAAQIQ